MVVRAVKGSVVCEAPLDVFISVDDDNDGVPNNLDNCKVKPNGSDKGTCAKAVSGVMMGTGVTCTGTGNCASGEVCQMNLEDCNFNGIGDVCECYCDTNCDTKVNLTDLVNIKNEFNRTNCATNPCQADCNGDFKVNLSDLVIMKAEFLKQGCPGCI